MKNILLALLIASLPAICEAYKCVEADGTVRYQDFMCEVNHPSASDVLNNKSTTHTPEYVGERMSLNFTSVDVRQVLLIIADVGGFKLDMAPSVQGNVAMRYVNIPWDQALDNVLKMKNLNLVVDGNTAHITARSK